MIDESAIEEIKENYYLTRRKLINVIEHCQLKGNWEALLSLLENIYSSREFLSKSFLLGSDLESCYNDINFEKADSEIAEKDDTEYKGKDFNVDILSLRKAYITLFKLKDEQFFSGLKKGISQLVSSMKRFQLSLQSSMVKTMNCMVIIFEIPYLREMMKFEELLPQVCEITSLLSINARSQLCEILSNIMRDDNRLIFLHQTLQQRLTLRLLTTDYNSAYILNHDPEIINTVYVIELLFYASILAGKIDSVKHLENERQYNCKYFNSMIVPKSSFDKEETISDVLSIQSTDCLYPFIPYKDFINETLNDCINIENDYVSYKTCKDFSFARYSFLLTTNTKRIHLLYDNRIKMRSDFFEDESSFVYRFLNPPFKIIVDRENIVFDTLMALENTIRVEPYNLKKRLYIEFKNEESIDEGGVSKEFFQLIIEKLFNPAYGMFTINEETGLFWFNQFPAFKMSKEYKLIGIIVGLAIYNNIILDLKLPSVLYRKLMGKLATFEDLKNAYPDLSIGLQNLLNSDSENFELIYNQNFEISIKDMFGNIIIHELKEGGKNIPLTFENKEEFVELYSDFLLNSSVIYQFNSFYEGFQMIVDNDTMKLLFRPDEIELLVCGSKNFDFELLQKVAKYDGGYSSDSETVKYFWEIVHEMDSENHSNLLQFTTGSDRIPIGGMKNMEFVIMKNGPDTSRLPTAHTCYNTLLLPEYSTKNKLKNCLLKAISYSTGFGIR